MGDPAPTIGQPIPSLPMSEAYPVQCDLRMRAMELAWKIASDTRYKPSDTPQSLRILADDIYRRAIGEIPMKGNPDG